MDKMAALIHQKKPPGGGEDGAWEALSPPDIGKPLYGYLTLTDTSSRVTYDNLTHQELNPQLPQN